MYDVVLQIGASKLVVSLVLATLAWVVQKRVAHPAVTHPLWLLVLVALLLPAVVSVPVLPGKGEMGAAVFGEASLATQARERLPVGAAGLEDSAVGSPFPTRIAGNAKAGLATVWLTVTALLLGWTLVRTFRFRRWLARTSRPAPPQLVHDIAEIGRSLGLARMPEVHTTTARVSPMVCWTGGRVRLVIPSFLANGLGGRELRAVLAHELAHVRRRDHLVRWIEWLACSAFWWNPVAWWARRQLRAAEEASCDALAVAATKSTTRAYAGSLLHVLEVMSRPPTPPAPAFASGVASGRNSISLQRRLRMLVKGSLTDLTPRWTRGRIAGAAACLLPIGLVYCGTDLRTSPTAPEEAPMEPPVDTVVVVVGPGGPDSLGAEPNDPWSGKREYAYWDLASNRMNRPRPLADAPVYPEACRLDPEEPDEAAREEAMAGCARALSRHLTGTDSTGNPHICVVWRPTARRWRGICEDSEAEERHRLHGNGFGGTLLERIVVVGSEG